MSEAGVWSLDTADFERVYRNYERLKTVALALNERIIENGDGFDLAPGSYEALEAFRAELNNN